MAYEKAKGELAGWEETMHHLKVTMNFKCLLSIPSFCPTPDLILPLLFLLLLVSDPYLSH